MSSAIGTLVSQSASAADGPVFFDKITMVGDAAYPTGGTLGFQAKLRALRGDRRTVLSVEGYADTIGYSVRYIPTASTDTDDLLLVYLEDQTSGVVAQVGNGTDIHALTFTLRVTSK